MCREPLEIYIHIPFCVKKCDYCDFLSFAASDEKKKIYIDALLNEIEKESKYYKDYIVKSVFIGGGTPSAMDGEYILTILELIKNNYSIGADIEITMECNPGTLDINKLETYKKAGINRLSMGLQSANDDELKLLGRIHDFETFINNYELARSVGFNNINVDLISGIPGQDNCAFEKSLNQILALSPEHISVYSLIIEEGTVFYDKYGPEGVCQSQMISEDEDRLIYHRTKEILELNGYNQYEISNYSKKGYECRHNIGYWDRTSYVGFGIGAASLICDTRWKNTDDINEYINYFNNTKDIDTGKNSEDGFIDITENDFLNVPGCIGVKEDIEILSEDDVIEEVIMLGLRMNQGIELNMFHERFGIKFTDKYQSVINDLMDNKLVTLSDDFICLTDSGRDLANYVIGCFI